jgi:hypothetical protein
VFDLTAERKTLQSANVLASLGDRSSDGQHPAISAASVRDLHTGD